MIQVTVGLSIGNDLDCSNASNDMAIIHACKTCHVAILGYKGSLPQTHPHYLIYEKENHLYLNMVDMERELLPVYTHPIMKAAMDFIGKHISERKILVHCNQGQSRSPAIGLVYLARKGIVANRSYPDAVAELVKLYSGYNPGSGLSLYLQNNWNDVMGL
jgi:predicted protein tyrosine phosphatase